jgi:hypothetical protein
MVDDISTTVVQGATDVLGYLRTNEEETKAEESNKMVPKKIMSMDGHPAGVYPSTTTSHHL